MDWSKSTMLVSILKKLPDLRRPRGLRYGRSFLLIVIYAAIVRGQ